MSVPTLRRGVPRTGAGLISIKLDGRTDKVPRDAVAQFTVAVLFSILPWWLEHNPKLSPAEADAIFHRLTLPELAAAGLT